jgi:preprotein translocase subunit SecA
MSPSVRKILDEIEKLTEREHFELLAALRLEREVILDAVDRSWREEILRRMASMGAGTAALHDWQDVERELDEIVRG